MYLVLLVGEKTVLLGPGFSISGMMCEGVSRTFGSHTHWWENKACDLYCKIGCCIKRDWPCHLEKCINSHKSTLEIPSHVHHESISGYQHICKLCYVCNTL